MSLILIFVVTVLHNIDTFWNETYFNNKYVLHDKNKDLFFP